MTDSAAILPADTAASLEARLKALEDSTGTQLVVATVPSLEGYEIEDYGVGLLRAWGIGQKDKNNGAILLIAPNERKVRIEVGYGLEGVLTDAMSSQIIRKAIIPRFKAGDMAGGVDAGATEMISLLSLPAEEQAAQVAAAGDNRGAVVGGIAAIEVIFWVIVMIWVISAMSSGKKGRRRGGVVIWGPGMGGSWSSGGGGSSWGGGGGGFSGGGGSGGGGGASGGW